LTVQPTPSQTVGPFFWFGLCAQPQNEIVAGGPMRIEGRVLDGAGAPVPDAMVEVWQADESGAYGPDFGWGRCATDADGRYAFTTVKPGPVEGQAPHLEVLVFARGLLKPLLTRVYFPGDDHESDAVLASLDEDERETLVARPDREALRFDVHLQGERQTAFFAR
jgi:protocatechuate 3,4-dioxygenase alpha subunit